MGISALSGMSEPNWQLPWRKLCVQRSRFSLKCVCWTTQVQWRVRPLAARRRGTALHDRYRYLAICPSQEIRIHNPTLSCLRFGSHALNVLREFAKIAGHKDFIFGPEIGSPVDIHGGFTDILERAVCIQHHDHVVNIIGQSLSDLAPRRDVYDLPIRLSVIRCFAAKAWMLLIPGMTSYSKVTVPLAMIRSMILSVLS